MASTVTVPVASAAVPVASAAVPVASIVIPTYNQRPEYLATAINGALDQSVPVEVIIIDDGSDVPISAKGCPPNLRIIRHATNRGISAAINTGIAAMRSEWFAWLSSDDMIDLLKVERQVQAMVAARCFASYHLYRLMVDDQIRGIMRQAPPWMTIEEQRPLFVRCCAMNFSTIMLHRSVILDVGGPDETYRYGQDWEWQNRIGQKYLFHGVERCLGTRRDRCGNLTQQLEADPERFRIAREEDARIRATYGVA